MVVDLRTLTTDSDRRDQAIRERWLESDKFPFAEFVSTDALELPASYIEGQEVAFKLVGDMKIRDVTKQVTVDVVGKLEGATITGSATTMILMTDFGFEPPSVGGFVSVENEVTVKMTFTATEVQ
jgi:polyisoprenoid-binding protein YceI